MEKIQRARYLAYQALAQVDLMQHSTDDDSETGESEPCEEVHPLAGAWQAMGFTGNGLYDEQGRDQGVPNRLGLPKLRGARQGSAARALGQSFAAAELQEFRAFEDLPNA